MARNLHGKSFLRETRQMTEEPRPLSSASSPLLLLDPAVVRSLAASRMETTGDGPATSNPSPIYNGVQTRDGAAPRQWTQTDQDNTDAINRKRVMKELVGSWMDRLQLISVITTFFAATEAQLLVLTAPPEDGGISRIRAAANAILAGSLVIHMCAAIIAFLAAFFLVRYRLKEATKEEIKIETGLTPASSSPELKSGIWTTNPHLEEMGPFRRGGPPLRLLEHLHTLCMWLALVGFALALAGALCYSWARLPTSASVFACACMAVCWLSAVAAFFVTL